MVDKKPLTKKQNDFALAFVQCGNATEAYRTAYGQGNMSNATIATEAKRLISNPKVAAKIAALRAPAIKAAGMTVERTLKEVQRVSEVDPRRFYRDNGTMMPPSEWDDDMAAAVAFVKATPVILVKATGRKPAKIGYTYELKFWDKNAGLEKAMKHLGLFEKDNAQSRESLVLHVEAAKPVKRADG